MRGKKGEKCREGGKRFRFGRKPQKMAESKIPFDLIFFVTFRHVPGSILKGGFIREGLGKGIRTQMSSFA